MNALADPTTIESQLNRIEGLLAQGNALRSEAIALQKQAIDAQKGQLEKTSLINDQALEMQRRSRPFLYVLFAVIFVVLGLSIYAMFFGGKS